MGAQILSPNFLEQGLQKDLRLGWENSQNLSGKAPKYSEGSSVPPKYTVDICTGMPKKSTLIIQTFQSASFITTTIWCPT